MQRIIGEEEHTGLFQYFIRVIPTIYTNEFGHQVKTNQYTITDRFRPLNMPANSAVPSSKVPLTVLVCSWMFVSSAILPHVDLQYFIV